MPGETKKNMTNISDYSQSPRTDMNQRRPEHKAHVLTGKV